MKLHLLIKRLVPTLAACTLAVAAHADTAYPDRTIRLVVNYPAGGALDLAARSISERMSEQLGQTIVVENRAGASGIIGARAVAREKPDGYTLLATIDSLITVNPLIYRNTDFDPREHLETLGLLGTFNQILMVNKSLGVSTLSELMKVAEGKDLNYVSAGAGTPGHIAMESFKQASGIKLLHIPFKGNGPALNALVGSQVDTGFLAASGSTLQHIDTGTLVPLAVSGKTRNPQLPDVPTIAESAINGLNNYDMQFAFLLMAPKGLPANVSEKIDQALSAAMQSDQVKQRLLQLNVDAGAGTLEEGRQWLQTYGKAMQQVVQKADIKVE